MNKDREFPAGYRIAALVLTMAGLNLCAWGQPFPWVDANLPGSGRVTALQTAFAEPRDVNVLLAGTETGRIYRSEDDGGSWSLSHKGLGLPTRAILSVDGGDIVAAAGSYTPYIVDCPCAPAAPGEGGLFHSSDRGRTWTRIKDIAGATALAMKGSALYAAAAGGLSVSDDKGSTWKPYLPNLDIAAAARNVESMAWFGDTLYLAQYGAVLNLVRIFQDGNSPRAEYVQAGAASLAFAPPYIYRSMGKTAGDNRPGVLSRSRDGGATWEMLGEEPFSRMFVSGGVLHGFRDSTLHIRSEGGQWTRYSIPSNGNRPSLGFLAWGNRVFLGDESEGIRILEKGPGTWTASNKGLHDGPVEGLLLNYGPDAWNSRTLWAADGIGGMLYQPTVYSGWSRSRIGSPGFRPFAVLNAGNRIFAADAHRILHVTAADEGGTWETLGAYGATVMAVSDANLFTFSDQDYQLRHCQVSDEVSCMNVAATGLPRKQTVFAGPVVPPEPAKAMAASNGKLAIAFNGSVYQSLDQGGRFDLSPPAPQAARFLVYFRTKLYLGGKPFAAPGAAPGESGILYAWDGTAQAWKAEDVTGAAGSPKALAFRGEDAFLGTDKGVFMRGPKDKAWKTLTAGLADPDVHSLAVQANDLVVGLENGRVYRTGIEPVIGIRPGPDSARKALRAPGKAGTFVDGYGSWRRMDGRIAGRTR